MEADLKRLRRGIKGYKTFEYNGGVYHRSDKTSDWVGENFFENVPENLKLEMERLFKIACVQKKPTPTKRRNVSRKGNEKKLAGLKKIILEKYERDPVESLTRRGAKKELLNYVKGVNGFWEENYTSVTEGGKLSLFYHDVNIILDELKESREEESHAK